MVQLHLNLKPMKTLKESKMMLEYFMVNMGNFKELYSGR